MPAICFAIDGFSATHRIRITSRVFGPWSTMHNLVLISLTIFLGVTIVKWIAKRGSAIKSIAIFHPFWYNKLHTNYVIYLGSDAGGGGERVLWTAIGAIQNAYPGIKIFIYTAKNDLPAESIMQAAKVTGHLI